MCHPTAENSSVDKAHKYMTPILLLKWVNMPDAYKTMGINVAASPKKSVPMLRKQWGYKWFIRESDILYVTINTNSKAGAKISVKWAACPYVIYAIKKEKPLSPLRYALLQQDEVPLSTENTLFLIPLNGSVIA